MKRIIALLVLLTSFSTFAEPLWMRYPSISPDGSTIVFSYQGDLFKVNTAGGRATQLTTHSSYDFNPIWSPDGSKIAFASDRHGNFDVFIMDAKGGEAQRLTFHSSKDLPFDFSPKGDKIIYGSYRMDEAKSVQFPYARLGELYEVGTSGGRERQLLTVSAESAQYSQDGKKIIFHNRKGYENDWRKHHTSSVTRDLVIYDTDAESFEMVTKESCEDRNPIWNGADSFYFLSEKSGSFNIWKGSKTNPYEKQLTSYKDHPVRFLSKADDGTICFGFKGEIYVLKNDQATKVSIEIRKDQSQNASKVKSVSRAGEFAVSSNKKEVAFIHRGEVFVTSIDYNTTKRITNTPEQERSVSFSPDGDAILYASERNESWNIYETKITRESEKYFYNSTLLEETELVNNGEETFQPEYSPDGKEIGFLENRTTLKVYNIESKKERVILDGGLNYSYSDGDQYFTWAPDSKWLLVEYMAVDRWRTDIGLVNSTGKDAPINLTESGYGSGAPKFAMGGEMVYYYTSKGAFKSHGGHGSHGNVEAVFLTESAYHKFILDEEEFEEWEEEEKQKEEEKKDEDDDKDKDDKDDDEEDDDEKEEVEPLKIDLENLSSRKVMLTIHASNLMDYLVNDEGTQLFYLSRFEKGYNLWTTKFKENETKLLSKLNAGWSSLIFDSEEKNILINKRGQLMKIGVEGGKMEPITFSSEMNLDGMAEREYMFKHAWRQVREKFYVEDLHGIDWDMYKKEYARYLPHITNGYDFAEMLSELLGELNASHTGAMYRSVDPKGSSTASLGCFFDENHNEDGIKVLEILNKGPLSKTSDKVKNGIIIEKIDGIEIKKDDNYLPLLDRKSGKKILLSFYDPTTKERWDETVKPISARAEYALIYRRWVKNCEDMVDELSAGRLGYVHVTGMNPGSYSSVYDKAKGKYNKKEGLIVDTRFNGGGWLHDDLATFLSGELYMSFEPRGQKNMGGEPLEKWQKPSCVLMSEGNYSDAHLFPYIYKQLGIGKLIGMPVPGTGTAVWWETMIDGQTTFGIPQVGMRSITEGFLVENHDLLPDIEVNNEYEKFMNGEDQQLAAAVKELLK
ncbi:MAG: tricorn protease [Arenicella sp.]|jgi:tricorn protease